MSEYQIIIRLILPKQKFWHKLNGGIYILIYNIYYNNYYLIIMEYV